MSKRILQCLARCPICLHSYDPQERRCLGGRGHTCLHQCKKHAWGTLEQRLVDAGRQGRYAGEIERHKVVALLKNNAACRRILSMSGVDDF
jgi:hypothetical protein